MGEQVGEEQLLVMVSTLSPLYKRSIPRSCCGYRHVTRMESCVHKFGFQSELYRLKFYLPLIKHGDIFLLKFRESPR